MSLCRAKFTDKNDPACKAALAIIRAGKEMLAKRPRADMPGFRLVSEIEIKQEAKYQAQLKAEADMRAAIASGTKQYERKDE